MFPVDYISELPAIYLRTSKNDKSQLTSIKYQEKLFRNLCEEHGFGPPKFYVDRKTGTTANRDGYEELIADIKDGNVDLVMSKELGRLARNQALALELQTLIDNQNVDMVLLDGSYNTFEGNIDNIGLYGWVYQQEAQATSRRIKKTLETKAKEGIFIGSIPPYGYKKIDGKLHIRDDDTPETVRRIYNEYIGGKGFDAIAHGLYRDGKVSPSMLANKSNKSELWHGSSVRLILENPHYVGHLVQHRTRTSDIIINKKRKTKTKHIVKKNTHDAIISENDFNLVQKLIEKRRKNLSGQQIRAHKNVNLFTNMISCKQCGSGFHHKKNRKGYICGKYDKHGKALCTDHLVLEQFLIDTIQNDLKRLVVSLSDSVSYNALRKKANTKKEKLKKEIVKVDNKIEKLNNAKLKTLRMYRDELITREEYEVLVSSDLLDVEELTVKRSRLLAEKDECVDESLYRSIYEEVTKRLSFEVLTREILNRFVDRIEIGDDQSVDIYYKFRGNTAIMEQLMK